MGSNITISHSHFVDDILILGKLYRFSLLFIFNIFNKFANATGLHINNSKYVIYHGIYDTEINTYIEGLFGVKAMSVQKGMKYLGYHIKPAITKLLTDNRLLIITSK